MAKQTLNLGAVLSDILKNSNSNFTELYDAIAKIQEKIADDGEKAVVYSTVDKMIAGLNAGTDEAGKALDITIGDEIYILDDETPDFWVSAVSTTSTTGTKPASWEKGVNYAFGKYTIRVSKSREIDLADYQKIANMDTGDSLADDTNKTKYPSSHTVYTWVNAIKTALESSITKLNNQAHTHSNKSVLDNTTASYTTEEKKKLGNIDSSLEGVTDDEIGKVKDVKVNGTSVLGTDGVASISIADLASGYLEITADNTHGVWTTQTVNGTTYQALRFQKTDTALGVFNSSGQEIVVQKTYDATYMYLCVGTSKINCFVRKLSGGAVGVGGSSGKYLHNISLSIIRNTGTNEGYTATIYFSLIDDRQNKYTTVQSVYDYLKSIDYYEYLPCSGTYSHFSESSNITKLDWAYPLFAFGAEKPSVAFKLKYMRLNEENEDGITLRGNCLDNVIPL